MCLSLSNPEFVSILDKKVIFSKGHPYSISILVSQCSPIMLASFKSKIWNVFCPAIFLNFRMVCLVFTVAKNVNFKLSGDVNLKNNDAIVTPRFSTICG
jgi:hypothetical protein